MSIENYVAIDREELARLRADSAELARVREPVEMEVVARAAWRKSLGRYHHIDINLPYMESVYGSSSEDGGVDFELHQLVRLSDAQRAIAQARQIPEGFALVPVEPKYRNPCVCKECGSKDLSWFTSNVTYSGVQNGRLKTSEVTCLFVLGCNECSATVEMRKADWFADRENSMLAAAQKGDSHE